jgi:hypothetical protein
MHRDPKRLKTTRLRKVSQAIILPSILRSFLTLYEIREFVSSDLGGSTLMIGSVKKPLQDNKLGSNQALNDQSYSLCTPRSESNFRTVLSDQVRR